MAKILIADDAPFIREIVKYILLNGGHELVAEASNGEEAVSLAATHLPDIILMDMVMPVKNGIDATREILAAIPAMKVIAFSTASQEQMVMRALEVGCCSFVEKPFDKDGLLKVINNTLGGS